jgi:hypothetical protein
VDARFDRVSDDEARRRQEYRHSNGAERRLIVNRDEDLASAVPLHPHVTSQWRADRIIRLREDPVGADTPHHDGQGTDAAAPHAFLRPAMRG